jgi:glycosyltransferase involved in cell wall biosynthesis
MASVSVGLFTYNRPDHLEAALGRLTNQTYRDLEIIVSDNASTDARVAEVLDAINDPRITVYRQPQNIGALANADFVRSKATGEFFMWCADDDRIDPTFIERMVEVLRANPDASMAFCDFEWVRRDGAILRRFGLPSRAIASSNEMVRAAGLSLLGKGGANLFYAMHRLDVLRNAMTSSALLERYGDFGVDVLFIFDALQRGRVAWHPQVLYWYTTDNEKLHELGPRMPAGFARLALYTVQLWLGYARLHLITVALSASAKTRLVMLLMTPVRFAQLGVDLGLTAVGFVVRKLRPRRRQGTAAELR